MPGIAGVCSQSEKTSFLLEEMTESLKHRHDYELLNYKKAPFYGSLAQLKELASTNNLLTKNNKVLIFDGELYNNDSALSDAEYILNLYEKEKGFAFLAGLEGAFSFSLFDGNEGKLYLVSDKFGLKPLYYAVIGEDFLFASEVKAFFKHPNFDKTLDYEAIGDLFYFSFVTGDKTLLKAVKLLPQASVLTYSLKERLFRIIPYWDNFSLFTPKGEHKEVSFEDLVELFKKGVKKRLKKKDLLGISISGGLDSRSILAALGGEAQGMPSYTLGLPGCEDERLSARMARIMGTRHEFIPITREHLKDFLALARALVLYSDGFYHPHESTEKVALDYFKKAPFKILFRGHGGEIVKASLAFPVQVDKTVLKAKEPSLLNRILLEKANLVLLDLEANKIFANEELKIQPQRIAEERLAITRKLLDKLSPADVFLHFYLCEYVRRQVVASLTIFRNQTEIRLPFLDETFLKEALRLPVNKRWEGEIHVEIVKRCAPALVKVPNSNTGAPLDAGKFRLWLTDKFNSLLKKISVPGFRHYTEFDKWQRKYFREALEEILFDRRTLDRGIYNPEVLKKVFSEHISGSKNYARFLGTAAGLELWLREFVD
ncbi:asparagine synthase-related protein [Thermodesulfatator autotrophicus]|uniref:asparagine synthase (glutamine-hydrolyzing) n=1 Tax=Thermodesulfatator autotrophicus TaxID=1795632 RepID=A0A177E4V3_9BACT|nr:asparagine synthase-related protein [Thermodesulfatator autotrophicus]OAG26993.1 hypothetical protein TH606_09195 [Thermodesulfatator autotrophicus]